ncbi:MAG: InlB B-repeat-containing protein, partial [Clostridiales bacterium]|nr:InlB B-repeat-containing protein [Clostridiales bacterium]
ATDTDGNTAIVTGYTLSGDNTDTVGTVTVTVMYDGKTATFTIEVTQITVTFTDGETELTELTATVDFGGTISAPAAPTKDGYTFGGWTLNGSAYTFGTPITESITLVAEWGVVEYTITYVLDGTVDGTAVEATLNGETTAYTVETDTFTLAIPTVTTDGIHFLAWHLGSESGEVVTAVTKGTTGNITLYAEYTQNSTVNLIFNYNYGETPETKTVTVISGTAGSALSPAPSRDGYDFGGWYTDAECTILYTFPTMDGDMTVYAKWNIQEFTVMFKDGNTVLDSLTATVDYNGTVTKPADPTKDGYRFDGWYKNEALTTAWDFENEKVTADVTIYAKWTAVYTVTFDSNGGSTVATIENVEHGSKITKPADPTKDGFTFTGWMLDGSAFDFDTAITANITLVATWEGATGTFLRYSLTPEDEASWVYGYKAEKNDGKDELAIRGVKIYNNMEFVVTTKNAEGNNIWLNAGISDPCIVNDAITVTNVNGNFKFTITDASYNGSGWTIFLYYLSEGTTVGDNGELNQNAYAYGISMEARNSDENRAPDGTVGGLTFGEVPEGAIYIAGTFTDGFKYDKAWSTASDAITVLNKNGVYTFRGVQLKKNDAFKIVNNGWWGGNFTAVDTEIELSDNYAPDLVLATLTDGKYDIVYNSNDNTLKIVAFVEATTASIAVTHAPNKTTYYKGEAFDATGLVITATDTLGNSEIVTGYTLSNNNTNTT